MKPKLLESLALVLALGAPLPGFAGVEAILGKWLAKAETPAGPVELEIEIRQEGAQLVGTAVTLQASIPLQNLVFEEPNISVELRGAGGQTFRLKGTLKDGRFSGTYEQVGGDMKGPWSMERRAAPASAPATDTGISGTWSSVSVTPNGDLALVLELKQEGEKVTGTVGSEMGTLPIKDGSYKDNALRYDVEFGGNTYRTEGTLKDGKFTGKWSTVGGTDSGPWSAARKAAPTPAPAPAPAPAGAPVVSVDGRWTSVAITPSGNINFEANVKQAGATL